MRGSVRVPFAYFETAKRFKQAGNGRVAVRLGELEPKTSGKSGEFYFSYLWTLGPPTINYPLPPCKYTLENTNLNFQSLVNDSFFSESRLGMGTRKKWPNAFF